MASVVEVMREVSDLVAPLIPQYDEVVEGAEETVEKAEEAIEKFEEVRNKAKDLFEQIKEKLDEFTEGHLLVDCRSSAYASAYKSEAALPVRVLRERVVDGQTKRSVVSHMAKATRGDITRSLLLEDVDARTPEELADALRDLGHTTELGQGRLDVVIRD